MKLESRSKVKFCLLWVSLRAIKPLAALNIGAMMNVDFSLLIRGKVWKEDINANAKGEYAFNGNKIYFI